MGNRIDYMETGNKFMQRRERASQQSIAYRRSPKQEKNLSKRLQAQRIPGSGSGKTKGDIRLKGIARLECKTTSKKSFSVTREMVEKIENASICSDELPAIVVEFLDAHGQPEMEIAIVPSYVLEEIFNVE